MNAVSELVGVAAETGDSVNPATRGEVTRRGFFDQIVERLRPVLREARNRRAWNKLFTRFDAVIAPVLGTQAYAQQLAAGLAHTAGDADARGDVQRHPSVELERLAQHVEHAGGDELHHCASVWIPRTSKQSYA